MGTVNRAIKLGVGEIIFTDADKEGTMEGTNKNLLKKFVKLQRYQLFLMEE